MLGFLKELLGKADTCYYSESARTYFGQYPEVAQDGKGCRFSFTDLCELLRLTTAKNEAEEPFVRSPPRPAVR